MPEVKESKKEVKEKKYPLEYTEAEIAQEVADLLNDEEMALFLRVGRGGAKYEKYVAFIKIQEQIEADNKK